jgi:hypothetical protein
MFTLKGPQKASIVLKVSGVTSKKSYDTYWDRLNRLFSQCLMIVRVRLRLALIKQLEPKDVENILNTAIPLAVVAFSKINQLSNKEREDLEKTFLEISSENALNPFKDDKDQMNRLFEAHGKKPTLKEIVAVVLAMQRSLSWIHPWPFVENWKRLKSQ